MMRKACVKRVYRPYLTRASASLIIRRPSNMKRFSSGGGFILDIALASNKGVAVFSPVINGVGGNLVAVFSSRLSTFLHGNYARGTLPDEFGTGCVKPCFLFCGAENPQKRAANVMLLLVVPGQLIFLGTIAWMKAGHVEITLSFTLLYLFSSLLQVSPRLKISQI